MIGLYKTQLKQLLLTALFLVTMSSIVIAQTVWTGNVDGDWDNPANWSAGLPISGGVATVPGNPGGGNFPTYDGSPILNFTLQNGGTVTFNVVIYNAGTVINFASGNIINNALFINAGSVTFDNDGEFNNNGIFENYGLFDNAASAVLNNNLGASFYNFNELRNTGLINNKGQFTNSGDLRNTGSFQNYGQLDHFGNFENTQGSSFTNNAGAAFHPEAGSDFMLNGLFTNDAEVIIKGRLLINVAGALNNSGSILNNELLEIAGLLDNNGSITNNNLLLIQNSGKLTNNSSFSNNGNIEISVCGTLVQQDGGNIGGSVLNDGLIYAIQGSVAVTAGDLGVVLTDLNDRKPPVAGCRAGVFVSLDENGNAELPVTAVDKGSYGNCGAQVTSVTLSRTSFTTADLGQQVVTMTVEDEFGFVSTCDAIVTVFPYVPPVTAIENSEIDGNCPTDVTVVTEAGATTAAATWTEPTATSNCQPNVVDCSSTPNEIPGLVYLGELNNSKYYCSNTNDYTWQQAQALAVANGGYLAVINDATENEFIRTNILNSNVWIGYTDEAVEGQFAWINGDNSTYTNWRAGEPNDYGSGEDYVHFGKSDGKWNDNDEWYLSEALIEIPCQATPDCSSQPNDISGFIFLGEYNNSKYYCSNTSNYTWHQAKALTEANGGHLAVINDAAENNFVKTKILNYDAWIGYTDEANEGHFVWVNGDNSTFTSWRSGEPNNSNGTEHYTRLLKDSGEWTDRNEWYTSEILMEIPCGTPNGPETCTLANHGPSSNGIGERLVWINFDNVSEHLEYAVEGNGISFKELSNGTALITGTISEVSNSNAKWEVNVKLIAKRTWAEWSGLGRSYKANSFVNFDNHTEWSYYEVDNSNSTFTGAGSNAGQVLQITHSPADYQYGFQVGVGANLKDADYGLSGWYSIAGSATGGGDFNGDLTNCQPTTGGSGELTIEQIRGLPSGSEFPVGSTTIAYEITDECGNVEICTFEIIVEGTPSEISLLSCPTDIVINTLPGDDKAVASWNEPTGTTTCYKGGLEAIQTLGDESGSEFPVGTTLVAYSVIDSCGNFVPCFFNVTIVAVDAELTVTSCQDDIITDAEQVTYPAPTGTTNCYLGTLEIKRLTGPASGAIFPVGVTPVVYLLSDECGNTEICSFTVTVEPPCSDGDNDGVCDEDDICQGFDDAADEDGDGIPDGCDDCNGNLVGTACNDNDDCTTGDIYDADCNCAGTFQDSDNDGVCDADDICDGFDDNADADGDGTPDGCDDCDGNLAGTTCNDNDDCTTGDVYDANCNCAGTFQDSDNDGVCDVDDICNGFDDNADADGDGTPDGCDDCDSNLAGTACNDGDDCTTGDVYDADCNCAGTYQDSDNDGVCDADDICQGFDDNTDTDGDGTPDGCDDCDNNLAGTACNDGDDCTTGDVYDADCNCAGTFQDSDNDGICDADDICDGFDDNADADGDGTPDGCDDCDAALAGTACNDGDDCTTGDVYDADCNCAGTFQDSDNDGVCDADDICNGFDDNADADGDGTPDGCDDCNSNLAGTTCDDGDDCTIGDVYDADCNCAGTFKDSDKDGVCDADDICQGFDDNADADGDGTPDGCDDCDAALAGTACNDGDDCTTGDVYDADCNCAGTYQDSDNDGVCDADDICNGFDDNADADGDGTPDGCDDCDGNLAGTSCNDGDDCTTGDVYDADCNCAGTYQDSDNDGVCDADDICQGFDDNIDTDGDGTPDGCDDCDAALAGTACNDGDDCTTGDVYDADCNCVGTFQDSDNDGVCDADDVCDGYNDTLDADSDGIPDGCDDCDGNLAGTACDDGDDCTTGDVYDADCNCAGTYQDSDNDGVCDSEDICQGFDDAIDTDNDGIPDGCEVCDNLTDGGHIGYTQSGCNPFDPNTIGSIADPSGGSGAIEIIWMQSNVNTPPVSVNNDPYWTTISGATSRTYDPGELTQTTYFIRCSRRAGCDNYVGESNILEITVEDCNSGCQDNLVSNPGFENGLNGWSIDHPVYLTSTSYSGHKAAKVGRYSGGFWQNFSINEGQLISMTAYAKLRNLNYCRWAGMGFDFYDEWGNYLHTEYQDINTSSYEQFSLVAVAPENATHVCVWFWKNGRRGRLFVDDVCVNITGTVNSNTANRPILDLQAEKEGQSVSLTWATNTEYKNDYFIIEHSTDGEHYEQIDKVESNGSGRSAVMYSDIHHKPLQGENFYRVNQIFTNGSSVYTNEQKVTFEADPREITLYPNPTSDEVNINLKEYIGEDATIQIVNSLGQPVYERQIDDLREPVVNFDVTKYGSGVYSINIKVDGHPQVSRMFVVSRK